MWTQVCPREGRDGGTMSSPGSAFEQLSLVGAERWKPHSALGWVGFIDVHWPCSIVWGSPAWSWSLLFPQVSSAVWHTWSSPERRCEHDRCVLCERCLEWYRTGYLSIALPDPERPYGWASKLEMAEVEMTTEPQGQPPLGISFFLALAAPCTSGPMHITPSCAE